MTYRPSRISTSRRMAAKSMAAPGTCISLAVTPSKRMVVALPSSLGPTIMKVVLAIASSITRMIEPR
jgi:hypothetical protein